MHAALLVEQAIKKVETANIEELISALEPHLDSLLGEIARVQREADATRTEPTSEVLSVCAPLPMDREMLGRLANDLLVLLEKDHGRALLATDSMGAALRGSTFETGFASVSRQVHNFAMESGLDALKAWMQVHGIVPTSSELRRHLQ